MIKVLLMAVSMVALADALLTTVIGVRLSLAGVDTRVVGLIMSGYWLGYVAGGFWGHRIVEAVGRIRTFAGFAGLVTVCVLVTALTNDIVVWAICRALTGYGCAVLFLAAESWLNAAATSSTRGGIFAGYMVSTYFAMALGQFALDFVPLGDSRLLVFVALCFAAALMPLVLTKGVPPTLGKPSRFGPLKLVRTAPLATFACAISGLTTSAFYGLAPLYFQALGFDLHALSWLMASAIFGGLAGQWPLGRLSDVIDRRKVLLSVGAALFVTSALVAVYPHAWGLFAFCILSALDGAFLFVIYPIAVARANDVIPHDDVVAASGALILVDGAGSMLGPLLGGLVMHWIGNSSLFLLIGAGGLGVAIACASAIRRSYHCASQTKPFVMVNTRAAAGALEPTSKGLPVRPEPVHGQ